MLSSLIGIRRQPFQPRSCLGVSVCEVAAMAAGVEEANQATIEIRNGQAVLGSAVVS